MGYTKDKKRKNKKKQDPDFSAKLKGQWIQKRPILFFVLIFGVLMILFYVLWLSPFFIDHIQPKIVSVNAFISTLILNIFGLKTQATGGMIISPVYSISVSRGCDAIEAMAMFASALLAYPARWKMKLIGFFAGIGIMFLLNIIRIVSLFLTGLYYPKAFDLMHVEVWHVLFIFISIGLWLLWITKLTVKKANVSN